MKAELKTRNLKEFFKKYPGKIPKIPRIGEIWYSKKNPSIEWTVSGLCRVGDLYSLVMAYPECDHKILIVLSVNESHLIKTYTSDTLDQFLLKCFFKK